MYKLKLLDRSYLFSVLLVLSGLGGSPAVQAELKYTGHYWGLMYSDSSLELDDKEDSTDSYEISEGHFKGKYGYMLSDVVSFEAHLGATNSEEYVDLLTYGGYLRANWKRDGYQVYGLIGGSGVRTEDDETESGGSYGVGLEIFGSKTVAISFEYLTLFDKSVELGDLSYETLGIGFTYYFVDDTSQFNRNRNRIKSLRY